MLKFERIDYAEGMNTLYADNSGKYDKVSELDGCCIGDFVASLEMEFEEETDTGVCLFGNPNMCFQTSGLMDAGDGGANFGQYTLFILNLMKDGLDTLDTEEKKAIVKEMIRDYKENGVEHGDVLVLPPADQPAENEFYVRKTHKGVVVEEQLVCGRENALEIAKEKMMVEFRQLVEQQVNVNVARVINLGTFKGYRLNNVTVITVETGSAV